MKQLYLILFFFVFILSVNRLNAKENKGWLYNSKINAKEAVYGPPSATIVASASLVCQNSTNTKVTLTGSGGTAPYTFTYTINGVLQTAVTTGANDSIIIPVTTTSAGTFNYVLESLHDSSMPIAEITQTGNVSVIVNAPPTVNFSFIDNQCSGSDVQFNSIVTGSGIYTYLWDFGDGTPVSTQQNPLHSFNALGCGIATFNVTLTVMSGGCAITKMLLVSVKQKPDISFVDVLSPFDPFSNCSKASSDPLYAITVGNTSSSTCISSFSINWGDGIIENNVVFPISHTYSSLGAYSMVITAKGINGCDNSKTYIIKNVSNPLGGLNSPGSTQNLCAPTPNLQFSISNWGTNSLDTSYTVNYGDGTPLLVLTQNDLVHSSYFNTTTPSLSANYPIPHIYTTSSCPAPSFQVKLDVTNACSTTPFTLGSISVLTKPVANFTAPPKGCVNTNILFTNTTIAGYGQNCDQKSIFTWDFGDGTIITSPLSLSQNINHIYALPGIYMVTLTAENICGKSQVIPQQICIEPPLAPNFTLNTASGCIANVSGSALSVVATNTTPLIVSSCTPPTYVWSVTYASAYCGTSIAPIANQTTTDASYNFTEPGTYTIKLTATNSCGDFVTTKTVTVKKPPIISAINGILSNYCGIATINPTAIINSCTPLTGTLTYAWSFSGGLPASSTDENPTAISYATSGMHTVALIVKNECGYSVAFTKDFTISDVPALTIAPLVQNICSGTATSVINLTSSLTGTTYSWTGTATSGITGFVPSGITNTIPSQTITNTTSSTGTVTYVITPLLNGCSGTPMSYVITINPAPFITVQPVSSTICIGGIPDTLNVTLNNASGSATYQWYSNTVNNTTTGIAISGETNHSYLPNPTVGVTYYYCVITLNTGGCVNLISNSASVSVVNSPIITTQPLVSQNLCVGATIPSPLSVIYSGGAGTPTYQWYSNTSNSTVGGTPVGANSSIYTPPVFTTAGSNFYYVTVTFTGNNCGNLTSSVSEIVVNNDPTIATQPISSQTVCQNSSPTALEVVLTTGIGIFSYQWYSNTVNNTSGGTIITVATNSTYLPSTALAGTKYYYCIITQNGVTGCEVTSATAAVITTVSPSFTTQPLSSTICLGQSTPQLSVAYSNGSGAAQYQWFSNTSNSIIGGTPILSSNSATYQPSDSSIGTNYYYSTITFASLLGSCSVIVSNVAQITINPKATISAKTSIICSGTAFTIVPDTTSGDIVPIGTTYTWLTPTVTPIGSVTGALSESLAQNGISQTLVNTINSPASITYSVTPTTGSCLGIPFTIVVTVNPATNPNAIKTNSTCFGINNGSITTNITGGIPFSTGAPYSISWSGPNGFTSIDSAINALEPGTYTLTVLDASGCPKLNNYTIEEPSDISIITDVNTNVTCFGSANGKIAISVSGGTGSYFYSWTKDTVPFLNTEDISNLSPGTYVVIVSDANSCGPKTASFTITEPPILVVSLVSKTDIDCFGVATGAINITATGGTVGGNYSFSWNGPNGYTSSNQNLSTLLAGTYNLIVTDDLGCAKNLSIPLTQSSEIVINVVTTPIICYGGNNATIAVTLSGGNAPYQTQWSNLAVGLNQNNLAAGDYTITVTDNLGCQKIVTINIPSPPIFSINPIVTPISCFGANDGSIKLNLVGGIPILNLVWSDGSLAGTTRNNLGPGTYTATIIDGTPCQITKTFVIVEPQSLVLAANITNALDCSDANSGAINLLVSGGTTPFSYVWSNGAITEDLNAIPAGNYLVTVTDARNCTVVGRYSVVRPLPIVVKVDTVTDFNCEAKFVKQSFVAKASGGVPPYQLAWSSGIISGPSNEIMNTSQNGLVILKATDSRGCDFNYTFDVAIPELGTPSFSAGSIGFNTFGIYSISDPIQFSNTATGDYVNIAWDFGDGTFSNEKNPIHIYKKEGTYVISQTVTYPFGCIYVTTVTLNLEKGYKLISPTGFTPNNDGINDYFAPVLLGLNDIHFDVYDTWGSLIYSESGDNIRGWDGQINNKEAENGNYYFKITAKTFYGKSIKDQGTLVLIK